MNVEELGSNYLVYQFPDIAKEWDIEKNGEEQLETIRSGSNYRAHWKCIKGHEWQALVSNRTKGTGCPYCVGRKVMPGENDLAFLRPEIASEWHPTRNGDMTPDQFTIGSGRKVWWECGKGHEYEAVIERRVHGTGCPYCSGRKAILGENDLATLRPDIALEWHPTRNGDKMPENFMISSGKKMWWKCSKGHEWEAVIANRTKGSGCPYCAGQKVVQGENDLATLRPDIALEWHPTRNGDKTPDQFSAGSAQKVWWQCKSGHEWRTAVSHRNNGTGCPYCAGQKVVQGENDLATLRPDLALEWHPTLNGDKTSNQFMAGSNQKVWWECEKGHVWRISIAARYRGSGCPYCSGRKAILGENDLATLRPDIALEWHPTRNGNKTSTQYKTGSDQKVWWMCEKGHEWRSSIDHRCKGTGCPYCAGQKVVQGKNDLATLRPDIALEWHPTRNGDKTPDQFSAGSGKKVWWMCEKGHEWRSSIDHRTGGRECPYCTKK